MSIGWQWTDKQRFQSIETLYLGVHHHPNLIHCGIQYEGACRVKTDTATYSCLRTRRVHKASIRLYNSNHYCLLHLSTSCLCGVNSQIVWYATLVIQMAPAHVLQSLWYLQCCHIRLGYEAISVTSQKDSFFSLEERFW